LSRDAAVPPDGSPGPPVAPRLEPVRHGARGVSTETHVAGGVGRRLCLDVPAPFLTRFDLETPPGGLARSCSLFGHVVPVQAFKQVLAIAHQTPSRTRRVAPAGGADAAATRPVPAGPGCKWNIEPARHKCCSCRRL